MLSWATELSRKESTEVERLPGTAVGSLDMQVHSSYAATVGENQASRKMNPVGSIGLEWRLGCELMLFMCN